MNNMGKSEVFSMPINKQEDTSCMPTTIYVSPVDHPKKPLENYHVEIPEDMEMLTNQVAGHMNDGKSVGMIKHNGTVLKPMLKKECGERELYLYRKLEETVDRSLIELKQFVPKFYGTKTIPINGRDVECIVLEDLTKNFKEPCIMDIKIGRRTWDPNASYEKIMAEEKKYQQCKRDLGFCIPGFQVYKIYNNQICKFGKEYGKGLDKDSAEQALKTFLNADSGFCRSLIVQLLAPLWRIQHWARNQRRLRLYSSSILFMYDARRLREIIKNNLKIKPQLKLQRKNSLYRPMSLAVLNNETERIQTGFSGQLTKEGPILRSPTSPNKIVDFEYPNFRNNNNTWQKSMRTLKRTHSFQNNYDKDMQNKKQDYTYILDELCTDQKSELWASVKVIDFAHVFPADTCDIDRNYLEGVESLVRLFEEFLVESE